MDKVESALPHSRWRRCRALLVEVAREYLQVLADPAPVVCFSGFGESSLDIELGVWSEEMSYRPRHFRSDLNFAIERKLREAGIEIPFPQRDVHIRTAPPADSARGENPPPETPRAPR